MNDRTQRAYLEAGVKMHTENTTLYRQRDELIDERDQLKSKLTEMESVLQWASNNVWNLRLEDGQWVAIRYLGIYATPKFAAPTLYEALHKAWEGREK